MRAPMPIHAVIETILAENTRLLATVEEDRAQALLDLLTRPGARIFLLGEGRSGLVGRMFAMRLMHAGLSSFVIGESTTPAIAAGDLLIAISGSGKSRMVVELAAEAVKHGAVVAAITGDESSPLAALASVTVPLRTDSKASVHHANSSQFAGSLFEQSALLLGDAVFQLLTEHLHQTADVLLARHANLE